MDQNKHDKFFQPNLIFAGKANSLHLLWAPFARHKCASPLLSNLKQPEKISVTNSLDYVTSASVTKEKSLITLTPDLAAELSWRHGQE